MLTATARSLMLLCVVCLALSWAGVAHAGLYAHADSLSAPGVVLGNADVRFDPVAGEKGVRVALSAQRADLPSLGWRKVGLDLDGLLQRDELGRWVLAGTLRVRRAPGRALENARVRIVADEGANTLQVTLTQDKALADVALPMDQPTHAQITLQGLPAGWLQGLLAGMGPVRPTAGTVDADVALDIMEGSTHAAGQLALAGVAFDSASGTLAARSATASGRIGVSSDADGATVDFDGTLRGGEWLAGALYASLPSHPVQLSVTARTQKGALALPRLRLADPDALQLDAQVGFDAKGNLARLDVPRFDARFPAALDRYGKGLLRSQGLDGLQASGQVTGHLSTGAQGAESFALQTDRLDVSMGGGRLGVQGLHGALDWSASDDRPATRLGWRALQVYRIPNGAAEGRWRSRGGALSLEQPLAVPVLDGQLRVLALRWLPAAQKGEHFQTSLALTQIDMAALCRALGWPEFKGTIGGAVPSMRYVDDRVELAGGLSLNVFDGFVDITRMSLAQPFGAAPVLAGDIALRDLDLSLLTSVFDFGNITGRMSGGIEQLRLVGWQPAAFKAHLLADRGGRISQKAVNNLTSVGGGSMAGGLQGTVMKLFKTFGYRRIGLSCELSGDTCTMGGLGATKDGYTIVEGSGLPHLTVVGHQRQVDWPTLVRRLRAATEGGGPVVK